ncbi:MAG: ubiquitin carboxyl-hydrolase [Bacteroidaceae bacterium]|nr:ubiquitin carboxyl-hydrolase [Bacteroidaceae bacterium]
MTKKGNNVNKNESANNQTRVVCPECGAEFDILAPHEHQAKDVTVLGVDSGLGTIYLPVSKRAEALKKAGIDTSKYFAIPLPTGGSQWMKMGDNGRAVPADADDPVVQQIIAGGTVPNKNLFRRWVMSQVFRALSQKDWNGNPIGFTKWMERHGYEYTWKMLVDELHTQTKLYGKDMENFTARNRWFNKDVAVAMAEDYIRQMRNNALCQNTRNCKGVPYIRVKGFVKGVFVQDIDKKLVMPLRTALNAIKGAKTAERLEMAVRNFWKYAYGKEWCYKQAAVWKDAYKGAGAYFTMQNLLRFHGCRFPKDNDFYERGKGGLDMLEAAANAYADDEGWRLFGLMKQMIDENHIDIEKKRAEWREEKTRRINRKRR